MSPLLVEEVARFTSDALLTVRGDQAIIPHAHRAPERVLLSQRRAAPTGAADNSLCCCHSGRWGTAEGGRGRPGASCRARCCADQVDDGGRHGVLVEPVHRQADRAAGGRGRARAGAPP